MEVLAQGPKRIIVGAGTYTDIISIDAPSQAMPGDTVNITVKIKNTYSSTIGIMVRGALEYGVSPWPLIDFPTNWANVAGGVTYSFSGSFQMPEIDVKIHAYSYYYAEGSWHFDDEATKNVKAAGYPSADIRNLAVVVTGGIQYPSADIRNLAVVVTGGVEYPSADIRNLAVVVTGGIQYPSADIKDLQVLVIGEGYPAADIKDIEVIISGGLPPGSELFQKLEVSYKKL
jgi:uncharacterized protein YaiE (UPF0345 family)